MSSSQSVSKPSRGLPGHSCLCCRKRRIKCDKNMPCGHCVKAGAECVFPSGKLTRKPRQNAQLLSKLAKLEGVVQQLSGLAQLQESNKSGGHSLPSLNSDEPRETTLAHTNTFGKDSKAMDTVDSKSDDDVISDSFGKLVIEEGSTQYIDSAFWTSLTAELEEVRECVETDSEDELDNSPSVDSPAPEIWDCDLKFFFFNHRTTDIDLLSYHPLPSQIPFYWEKYNNLVNPLSMIIHKPTTASIITKATNDLSSLDSSSEALVFGIYHAVVTTMTPETVQLNFGVSRSSLIVKYGFATAQALARSDFLTSSNFTTLQAFVLFVSTLRYVDARTLWSLTGMMIRQAFALGLHRDGASLGLPPFESEMRRRIWYHISDLDIWASDSCGSNPSIGLHSYDTKLPLNLNDDDIWPSMTALPAPRIGLTEMTVPLLCAEVDNIERLLSRETFETVKKPFEPDRSPSTFDEDRVVHEFAEHLEFTYLRYCDDAKNDPSTDPLYQALSKLARLSLSSLFVIGRRFTSSKGGKDIDTLPQSVKDRLLQTCIDRINYGQVLATDNRFKNIAWRFKSQVQWHAIAYVLREVSLREPSDMVEKGWKAVEASFQGVSKMEMPQRNNKALAGPVRKLMIVARRKRERDRVAKQLVSTNGSWESASANEFNGAPDSIETGDFNVTSPFLTSQQNLWPDSSVISTEPLDRKVEFPKQINGLQQGLPDQEMAFNQDMMWNFNEYDSLGQQQDLTMDIPIESWDDVCRDLNPFEQLGTGVGQMEFGTWR